MTKILDQTYNYAIITPFRNYSCIRNRNFSPNTFSCDIDEIADIETISKFSKHNEENLKSAFIIYSPIQDKKKIKYFYNDSKIDEKMELFTASPKRKNFYTTKDRQIKKYYGDPFCRMEVRTHKRMIYKDENKLIIKVVHISKYRSVNWKFFKESKSSVCISFNLKTGNFIIFDDNGIKKKHGRRGTRIRTNNFNRLKMLLKSRIAFYLKNISIIDEKTRQEFNKVFDDNAFISIINKELLNNRLPISITPDIDRDSDIIYDLIIENFVKKRGIKVPNDYKKLLINFYPLQKVLKKNDNKLIQSVLDMFKVKCKGTVKYLHENPNINVSSFIRACYLFGEDYYHYVNKIDPKYFNDSNGNIGDKYSVYESENNYVCNKDEKDNMLHIINSYMEGRTLSNNFDVILYDHFNMILKLRKYEPELKLTHRTYSDFNREHTRLSTLLSKISKGWTTEYQFNEKMLNDVESDLVAIKDEFSLITFKPYILKRDDDYNEEGSYMHHCVAGYTNKDKSIIVSLRTEDSIERVTCEFDIQSGRCIQSRYFTNKNPPDFFLDGLELLKEKIQKYARWGILNWTEKKKVPFKINGIEVIIDDPKPRTFNDVLLEDPFFNRL